MHPPMDIGLASTNWHEDAASVDLDSPVLWQHGEEDYIDLVHFTEADILGCWLDEVQFGPGSPEPKLLQPNTYQ